MKRIVEEIVKDGHNQMKFVWEIDDSKPKTWLDGHKYMFNKTLLSSTLIRKEKQNDVGAK